MPPGRKPPDRLGEYRAKRSAGRTSEPFGAARSDRPGLFVIHKHAATRLHYDLRLEMHGVLESWAVPKGPSPNPADKRLAMKVEDHPLEYAEFEGIIPRDNYGAGAMIIWDRGLWIPIDGEKHGLEHGKLLFELRGYKVRGVWTLVKTKRGPKDWLLIKKPDAHADPHGRHPLPEASILSGLTVEELGAGTDPAAEIRAALRRLRAPRREVRAEAVELMLAEPRAEPFTAAGWAFELKYDGFRLLAGREGRKARLRYRRGGDATGTFPEIARAVAALPQPDLVLDGEIVVLDPEGRPSFQRLQQRFQISRRADVERAAVRLPATYFAFDLLGFDGYDLRGLPLRKRKELLRKVLPAVGPLRYSDHIDERGEEMFAGARRLGLEGIVAKKADSPYRPGRSGDWVKIRSDRTGDFVIVGYTAPERGRAGFGALHLAIRDGADLVYAGRVGTGFRESDLRDLRAALDAARRDGPAFRGPVPTGAGHTWVEPRRVCEVRYKEWTRDGQLRHPAFLRLREDKAPEECIRVDGPREPLEPVAIVDAAGRRDVPFTNLDKVFWPREGYTKGDLIEFYRSASRWLLPYLEDRPVVLTRYPDGIEGKMFFQKDAPGFVPDWIRTETMWSEHAQREIHYFIADDEETLLYLANLGTIPLHIWSSRVATLQKPDWCILDLDPKGAPFAHVVKVARTIRALCEEIALPSHVKTSGSTGLHVLLPLGRQCTYEQSRTLGGLLARVVVAELPAIATVARTLAARKGRVYVDYLQNGHGRLLVAPLSVRPLPGAPVSTPLRWSEVNAGLDAARFTIRTVPRRLARLGDDPLLPARDEAPDLAGALERLGRRVGGVHRRAPKAT
jgi:bifunctional non-homologous end joining protein LigD